MPRYLREQGTTDLSAQAPYWIFDETGTLSGTGLLETIVLDDHANYRGSFTNITYDLNGKETCRAEGSL